MPGGIREGGKPQRGGGAGWEQQQDKGKARGNSCPLGGQCWDLTSPRTLRSKTPGVSWQEMGNRERLSPLGGGATCLGGQFWGALSNGESLVQGEANDHGEEATKASSSALASLCQGTSALPKAPRHCLHQPRGVSRRVWGTKTPRGDRNPPISAQNPCSCLSSLPQHHPNPEQSRFPCSRASHGQGDRDC